MPVPPTHPHPIYHLPPTIYNKTSTPAHRRLIGQSGHGNDRGGNGSDSRALWGGFAGGGQFQREGRALAHGAVDADPAVMGFDDVAAHREPQAGAALAAGVRTFFGGEERIENLRQHFRRNAAAVVAHHQVDHVVLGVVQQLDQQPAAVGHRLPGVDQQVQQHLLNLVAVDVGLRDRLDLLFDRDAILVHLAFEQQQRVLDQLLQIGRLLAGRAISGHAQHGVGDSRRPIAGGEDLFEAFVARGGVLVAHAHLGVIENRHQHVVELVRGRADQFAQGGQPLGLGKLLLEDFDLFV